MLPGLSLKLLVSTECCLGGFKIQGQTNLANYMSGQDDPCGAGPPHILWRSFFEVAMEN